MRMHRVKRVRAVAGRCRLTALLAMVALLGACSSAGATTNPLMQRGMWIWYVSHSDRGNVSSIISHARRYGIRTLLIKSGDGTSEWSQFSHSLINRLHAAGLKVCGWQYVYGNSPATEAHVGAWAKREGADCLMIDAEGEYEGRYVSAQTYIHTLRSLVGSRFLLALAGLPYVDYHPAFPYSVFLGPGAAQDNAPQMYWADIGTSVSRVYSHTYEFNRVYGRAIYPLGEVTPNASTAGIVLFRQLSLAYHAASVSWWDWQEASGAAWSAVSVPIGRLSGANVTTTYASLGQGAQGDVVVWAQEHLRAFGYHVAVDGAYGPATTSAVSRFQSAHGIGATGTIGNVTWHALLRRRPVSVRWTSGGAVAASASGGSVVAPVPKSAKLRARKHEFRRPIGRD
jgi:Putative peptidoglycan binding domain